MRATRLFIERPVATTLLMAALGLCGLLAWHFLPVAALPDVDFPTIEVVTLYPGASPEVMGSSITAPLEKQFGQMPGLDQMSSISSGGASIITLRFSLNLGLDVAEQEVQEGINAAAMFLPTDLPMPPVYNKVNPADAPVLTLAVTTKHRALPVLEDWVDTRIASPLSQISGVGLVSLQGGQRPAVRVKINEAALVARGLSLEDVRTFVTTANVNTPKGGFDGPTQASTLDVNDQLESALAYSQQIIAYKQGSPIRLRDVATVEDGAENTQLAAWSDNQSALLVSVQRQPGANVLTTVKRLRQKLASLQADLPSDVQVQVIADRTDSIRSSVREVSFELLFAVALVVLVIFIFLRNLPATVIPAIAVPLSLLGTLAVMYLGGMSINNLTLMAMTVATGFVVDDAIVMVENIARLCEGGLDARTAALRGARQMGFTIVSLTISLIAVLIPLLFMRDVIGRLFREFALTLAIAIVLSGLISLSLTPMLSARLLGRWKAQEQDAGRFWKSILHAYDRLLQQALEHKRDVLILLALSILLTGVLYIDVAKGFFPEQDSGEIQAITEANHGISFPAMVNLQRKMSEVLQQDPDVDHIASTVGIDGVNTVLSQGRMLITLRNKSLRPVQQQTLENLTRRATQVIGLKLFLKPVQDVSVDDQFSASSYRVVLSDVDESELRVAIDRLQQALLRDGNFSQVHAQHAGLMPAWQIDVNRDTAGRLGISMATIDNVLYDAYGQRLISTIFTQSNQYRVVLGLNSASQESSLDLTRLYVPGLQGQVPLSVLATWHQVQVQQSIAHLGQFPAVTLGFDLPPGVSLDRAMQHLKAVITQLHYPPRIGVAYQGALRAFEAALSNQLWLLLAAVLTMYLVLGVLYESFVHPLTILSTLPSAAMGALGVIVLTGGQLDVLGLIGIILLIGIVKKNAIMMIDFALAAERERGLSPRQAIHEACLLRLRPILMTTLCALVGALPLLLGQGMGSELRQPLGLTLVGGLVLSQLLTLFTTPVLYLTLAERLAPQEQV